MKKISRKNSGRFQTIDKALLLQGFFIFRLSQLRRERRGNRGLVLLTELPRGDLVPLFKGADQMTAVRKAGLGCNIVQVIVGKKKQVFNLVQADKLDILLTALPVMLQKKVWQNRSSSCCIYVPVPRY